MRSPLRQIALLLVLSLCTAKMVAAQGELSRHPYPQMPAQNSVALLWRTVGGTIPIVRYGTAPDVLDSSILPTQILVRLGPDVQGPPGAPRLHSAPPNTYHYEASVFGLQPDTTYYYGVYDNERLLAGADGEHSFTTLPPSDSTGPLRLWVVGDSGTGSASQIAGFNAMRAVVATEQKPIDAFLHLGDMAYNVGLDREFSANFFEIYTDLLRNTTCWPTMGNHEGGTSQGVTQIGPYYDSYAVPKQAESGGLASGSEAYYSFDIGRVHFICLNSHDLDRSPTGDMALWLKSDLEMADADWLIAFWHHPPYTKGTHNSDTEFQLIEMRENIMPILESGGVDLVLSGHSHIYERSMLIDGAYATPTVAAGVIVDDGDGSPDGDGAYRKSESLNPNEGTIAVVAGNGFSFGHFYGVNPIMRSVISEVGSVIIDIDGDTLTGRMINTTGAVRDTFQLTKLGVVEPQIVEFPWQPVGPRYVLERLSPDTTTVTIFPRPAAPDNVIYYTTDGSVPTSDSPIYTNPIEVSATTSVRAFSTWRGGERSSLESQSGLVDPALSYLEFLTAGADDGVEDMAGDVSLGDEILPLSPVGTVGLRFDSVQVPAGAYIHRAQVQFEKAATDYSATVGNIWGERSVNSAPFVEQPNDFTSRTRTGAVALWRPSGWSLNSPRNFQSETSDLSSIVAEQVAQPGWQSGNALSFFFEQSGTRLARAYDSNPGSAATLALIYIDPEGLVEQLARTPPQFQAGEISIGIRFRWLVPTAASHFGLSYEIETSPDLQQWEPQTPSAIQPGIAEGTGFQAVIAFLDAPRLDRDGHRFFRVRINRDAQNP